MLHLLKLLLPTSFLTNTSEDRGIEEVAETLQHHRSYLEESGGLQERRKRRLERRITDLVSDRLRVDFWTGDRKELLAGKLNSIMKLEATPYDIVRELVEDFHRH